MTTSTEAKGPRYIVGIGASAGGLDPIQTFFDQVPKDTGMAFVIVQHLSPDFKSLMDELLARHTEMPILHVEDGMQVEANHVYLIPPKKEMIISGGRLLLGDRRAKKELALPIDLFFRSLAQDCGPRAVAIVLSGGGSDGSRGIRDVRERGGLVIVQDTGSAQFDGMPKTARDAGVAQWVLPPQEMPQVLLDHMGASTSGARSDAMPRGLVAVYDMLQAEYGLDFTNYKPSTVTRRIERRIALASTPDLDEYVARLRRDRGELDILYRDLLIGVTHFFRDRDAFRVLEEKVLPPLVQRASNDAPLRIWVPGCATGEEAYSLAIAVQEVMARVGERPVKLFATDVHRGSLERAARGVYPPEAVANLPPERIDRYFDRIGSDYQIAPHLRQLVVFAAHNVIKDAPFTRVDLVSCRNLLIYLQPAIQDRVLGLFHFGLTRDGILFLGPSESPGSRGEEFEAVDGHWKVYRKHADSRLALDVRRRRGADEAPTSLPAIVVNAPRHSISKLLGTYDALLDDVMPPSLLVSEHGELLHSFAGASRFLKPRDGRQGLDVVDLVEGEFRMILGASLKGVLSDPRPLAFSGVRGPDGQAYAVKLRRITGREGASPSVLVTFEPAAPAEPHAERTRAVDLDDVSRHQIATLGAELTHTKESLQAAIEELQSTNEELQASNEELQASNEELQSTNEELQSVNEELYTVNAEYQRKIAELTELTNDMDNLLSSTDVGTIFLDRDLIIRKFTPQIGETFSLVSHDVGRSIETFAHKLERPGLVEDLRGVVKTGTPFEIELRSVQGKAFFMRVLPYRARGRVDGVVLTLIDVSGLKAAEDALFHERHLLNSLLSSVPDAIYFKDASRRFIRANRAMAVRLGLDDARGAIGRRAEDMPNRELAMAFDAADSAVLTTGQPEHYKLEARAQTEGPEAWDLVTRLPLQDPDGKVVGVIVIARNVTEQKRSEDRAREAVRRRDQFLAMLSHELRNPLGAVVTATALLRTTEMGKVPAAKRPLDVLGRQSHQMTRLLDDLLEVSRVMQDKIQLRVQRVDPALLARDVADTFGEGLERAGLSLEVRADIGACEVDADPARLQQVITNLLANAVKYTPRGGKVRLEVEPDGTDVVLRVCDTGVGIPPHLQEAIFDLFVQGSRTLDRSAGGIGVGLTLVRALVRLHGGSVTATSAGDGQGAEFLVRIPRARTDVQVPSEEGAPVTRTRLRLSERPRVVVIEDNEDSREMLCQMLALAGFECRSAHDGSAGLALIEEMHPDVAIVDIGLPGVDGFEVARKLRLDARHARVWLVALTGYGQASDRAATREAGFDAHFVKPVHPEQILRSLEELRGPQSPVDGVAGA